MNEYREKLMRQHRQSNWSSNLHGCFSVSKLVKKFSVKVIAEVGVCEGRTAMEVLFENRLDRYYFIDPWAGLDEIYKNIVDSFKEPCIQIIRKRSIDALDIIKDGSLDMVYIDARHEYDEVRPDIIGWSRKVKKNGIIAGHDYDHPWHPSFGVKKAADEIFGEGNINLEQGTVFWVIKR